MDLGVLWDGCARDRIRLFYRQDKNKNGKEQIIWINISNITMSNVDIVLSDLSFSVQMLAATMDTKTPPLLYDVSAVAVFTVSTGAMRDVFQFRTDSSDITNAANEDLKYFVDMTQWPVGIEINPANAALDYTAPSISSGAIAYYSYNTEQEQFTNMMVKHDFVRYLALQLFGSYDATDIFNNEEELVSNLEYICDGSEPGHVWYDISYALNRVSINGTHPGLTQDNLTEMNCMTNDTTTPDNLCREMFLQIAAVTPERLQNVQQTQSPQPLLFQDGDSINFTVNFYPADGQEQLTGVNPIPARPYQIKLYMANV